MVALCFYCGVTMATRKKRTHSGRVKPNACTTDHVVPQSRLIGGDYPTGDQRWLALNKVDCCRACNNRKGSMWPLDWMLVMPDYGVQALHDRLILLECERSQIIDVLAERAVTRALAA